MGEESTGQAHTCPPGGPARPGAGPAHLHGGDDEAPVHDELAERGRAFVAAASVHHEQPADVPELCDGEVRGQGGLPALLERAQGLPETPREEQARPEGTCRTRPPPAGAGRCPYDLGGDGLTGCVR